MNKILNFIEIILFLTLITISTFIDNINISVILSIILFLAPTIWQLLKENTIKRKTYQLIIEYFINFYIIFILFRFFFDTQINLNGGYYFKEYFLQIRLMFICGFLMILNLYNFLTNQKFIISKKINSYFIIYYILFINIIVLLIYIFNAYNNSNAFYMINNLQESIPTVIATILLILSFFEKDDRKKRNIILVIILSFIITKNLPYALITFIFFFNKRLKKDKMKTS